MTTKNRRLLLFGFALWMLIGAMPPLVQAHVKWFTDFSFFDAPQPLTDAFSPLLIGLLAAASVAMLIFVYVDNTLEKLDFYVAIRDWFSNQRDQATLILRIGMGVTFLLSWQADALLAPYLETNTFLGWVQFLMVLFLLFPQTTPIAGAGTIILWMIGVYQFGTFYMLDYLAFVGIGMWLLLSQAPTARVRELGIPAWYATVGFALIWLAMEKIIYPTWGLDILAQNPQLTLGLPPQFFLLSTALIEFTLGYLLIIGLLGRPLGLVITIVFFTTTLVFGKVEVIGHTHLHAALIVFLLYGPGRYYPAPIDIHDKLSWRMAFAAVNYVVLFIGFIVFYRWGAFANYEHTLTENITPLMVERCNIRNDGATIRINGEDVPCSIVLEYADLIE